MSESNITKNALAASLKKLMIKKPFDKISVSDICEGCGMNRKSFYYHFKDKYDLVNWIFSNDFLSKMNIKSYTTGWDAIRDVCNRFYEDRQFYLNAFSIDGQNSFYDYVLESIRPLVAGYVRTIYGDEDVQDFFVTFFCDAFLSSIMRWLSEGMQMDSEEFVDKMIQASVGLAKVIIRDDVLMKRHKEEKVFKKS